MSGVPCNKKNISNADLDTYFYPHEQVKIRNQTRIFDALEINFELVKKRLHTTGQSLAKLQKLIIKGRLTILTKRNRQLKSIPPKTPFGNKLGKLRELL